MRATRAHRDNRRSHHALDAMRLTKDVKTGSVHQRHHVDMATGMYRGRKILDVTGSALATAPAVTSSLENAPACVVTKSKDKKAKANAVAMPAENLTPHHTNRPVKSDGDSNKK